MVNRKTTRATQHFPTALDLSFLDNSFSHYGTCVLQLERDQGEARTSKAFILRNNK